jgi:hypothetical protein
MKALDDMAGYTLLVLLYEYNYTIVYSCHAHGVMIFLVCLHDIWAIAKRSLDDPDRTWVKLHDVGKRGTNSFDGHYRLRLSLNHAPSECEAADYILRQLQRIDERLGIVMHEIDVGTKEHGRRCRRLF